MELKDQRQANYILIAGVLVAVFRVVLVWQRRYWVPYPSAQGRDLRLRMQADQVVTGWVGGVMWNSLIQGYLLTQRDHWLVRGR